MKKTKDLNFWFNIFILVGMIITVGFVEFDELSHSQSISLKGLIISIGAIMGVLNSVLSANGNIWTFFYGAIEVSICAYANYDSGNMGVFLQHVLYALPLQFVGVWQWRKRGAGKRAEDRTVTKVHARRLTVRQWIYVAASFVLGTMLTYGILYWIDLHRLNAGEIASIDNAKILLDSSIVVMNILGQILMSFAFAEQWWLWNIVNVLSILLWTNRLASEAASGYTVVMLAKYVFYLLNSVNGLRIWMKLSREHSHDHEIMPGGHGCC